MLTRLNRKPPRKGTLCILVYCLGVRMSAELAFALPTWPESKAAD